MTNRARMYLAMHWLGMHPNEYRAAMPHQLREIDDAVDYLERRAEARMAASLAAVLGQA